MSNDSLADKSFQLLDLRNQETRAGDTVAIAGLYYGKSPGLFLGLITEIRLCPKTVRIYYNKIGDNWSRDTYISLSYKENGLPCSQFVKLENIEFNLNQKRFAKLFVAKSEFDAANPTVEEISDEE
jgi:hypothetical protein